MIKLMKQNLKGYIPSILIVFIMVFLQSLADLYLPTLNADITNNGIALKDTDYILSNGAKMLLIVLASSICSVIASFNSSRIAMGFGTKIRNKVFNHVETFSQGDVDKIGTASLITRTTNDITQVQNSTMMILRMMLGAPITCIGGLILAYNKSPDLSWIIAFIIPIVLVIITFFMTKGMPLFKVIQSKIDIVNQILRENLNGIRVIRAFNKSNHELKRFDNANLDLTSTNLKVMRMMSMIMPLMMLIITGSNIAIIWIGGHSMVEGKLQIGELTAFITYIMLILISIMMSVMMFVMLPRAQASAARINEVLSITPSIHDKANTSDQKTNGYIEFKNVTFSYPGAEEPVLNNISFTANSGEVTAIIGGTGSGKSTLINLIPRFYDITSGSITIDGTDIRDFSQQSLRQKIGFIPQKSFLFSGTIADNIRYGKEDATEEEILKALETAQASEFVSSLEHGIETELSQGGTNVSGGQRQRLSIARALVRKPEIYVFDDSFSALDFKTDSNLRAALSREIKNASMLIVAQRVSTIMNADKILVLNDGEIAGIGTHKELMETCEIYKEIVLSQLSAEEVA